MSRDPDKIGSDRIEPGKGIDTEKTRVQPDRTLFQSYMQEGAPAQGSRPTVGMSPAEMAQMPSIQTAGPSYNTLLAQVNGAHQTLSGIQDQLNTPNLKFKRQHQYLLKSKLNDANDHLASANARLGVPTQPSTDTPDSAGPVVKFLAYVTDGQNQLLAAKSQLEQLNEKGGQVSPSDMLLIQVKLSQAQQELEYSSTLLSKVVDFLKQMLSIQL